MEAKEQIRNYIDQNLMVFEDGATFSDSDDIFNLGYVNSLFAMQLLTYIQNQFEITIDDEDIEISNFSSIDNMIKLINKKIAA